MSWPLDQGAIVLVAAVGFEPTTCRVWTGRYNHLSYAAILLTYLGRKTLATVKLNYYTKGVWPCQQNYVNFLGKFFTTISCLFAQFLRSFVANFVAFGYSTKAQVAWRTFDASATQNVNNQFCSPRLQLATTVFNTNFKGLVGVPYVLLQKEKPPSVSTKWSSFDKKVQRLRKNMHLFGEKLLTKATVWCIIYKHQKWCARKCLIAG